MFVRKSQLRNDLSTFHGTLIVWVRPYLFLQKIFVCWKLNKIQVTTVCTHIYGTKNNSIYEVCLQNNWTLWIKRGNGASSRWVGTLHAHMPRFHIKAMIIVFFSTPMELYISNFFSRSKSQPWGDLPRLNIKIYISD